MAVQFAQTQRKRHRFYVEDDAGPVAQSMTSYRTEDDAREMAERLEAVFTAERDARIIVLQGTVDAQSEAVNQAEKLRQQADRDLKDTREALETVKRQHGLSQRQLSERNETVEAASRREEDLKRELEERVGERDDALGKQAAAEQSRAAVRGQLTEAKSKITDLLAELKEARLPFWQRWLGG